MNFIKLLAKCTIVLVITVNVIAIWNLTENTKATIAKAHSQHQVTFDEIINADKGE